MNMARNISFFIQLKLITLVLLLAVIDYLSLEMIENLLSEYIRGYQRSESNIAPALIFIPVAYAVNYLGYRYGWKTMLPYHLCAISVFFPLIFLTVIVSFYIGLPAATHTFYTTEMCPSYAGGLLCGQALAHNVFCMTMRALPLLIIIPAVFYGLLQLNFLNLRADYEAS